MKAMATFPTLAAVPAQQSQPLSQTAAVGPAAPTPPLTPQMKCPKLVLVSFLGLAPCLLPQARLLQHRWVPSDCWGPTHIVNLPDVFVYLCLMSTSCTEHDRAKSMGMTDHV